MGLVKKSYGAPNKSALRYCSAVRHTLIFARKNWFIQCVEIGRLQNPSAMRLGLTPSPASVQHQTFYLSISVAYQTFLLKPPTLTAPKQALQGVMGESLRGRQTKAPCAIVFGNLYFGNYQCPLTGKASFLFLHRLLYAQKVPFTAALRNQDAACVFCLYKKAPVSGGFIDV